MSNNTFTIKVGSGEEALEVFTQLCPSDLGLDSYIEQREGWLPTIARCFLTAKSFETLPEEVRNGTVPVSFSIAARSAFYTYGEDGQPRTPSPTDCPDTAAIFFLWKKTVLRNGINKEDSIDTVTTTIYELEFRTEQQWWDGQYINAIYNKLTPSKFAFDAVNPDSGDTSLVFESDKSFEYILHALLTSVGIDSVTTITDAPVNYRPLDVFWRNIPLSAAIRSLLDPMRMVLCHNIYTNKFFVQKLDETTGDGWDIATALWTPLLMRGDKSSPLVATEPLPAHVRFIIPSSIDASTFEVVTKDVPEGKFPDGSDDTTAVTWHWGDRLAYTGAKDYSIQGDVIIEAFDRWLANAVIPVTRQKLSGHVFPLLPEDVEADSYMHPVIRLRRISMSDGMNGGCTTYLETGPVVYDTPGIAPYQMYGTVIRPDGSVRVILPIEIMVSIDSINSVLVADRKWDYKWTQVRCNAFEEWETLPSGLTYASAGLNSARNTLETGNTAGATLQGNGIDFNAFPFVSPGTMPAKLKPIRGVKAVPLKIIPKHLGGVSCQFTLPNVVQEPCA